MAEDQAAMNHTADMKPGRSYIVWFSQRTGSTLLSKALEDTGIAGRPREWLPHEEPYDLMQAFGGDRAAWESDLASFVRRSETHVEP